MRVPCRFYPLGQIYPEGWILVGLSICREKKVVFRCAACFWQMQLCVWTPAETMWRGEKGLGPTFQEMNFDWKDFLAQEAIKDRTIMKGKVTMNTLF